MTVPITPGIIQSLRQEFSSGRWSPATERWLLDLAGQSNSNVTNIVNLQQTVVVGATDSLLGPSVPTVVIPLSMAELAPVSVPSCECGLGVAPWP